MQSLQLFVVSKKSLSLTKKEAIHRSSPLRWFTPHISSDGLIRVGGRLGRSLESEDTTHPIVLPAKYPFTTMLYEYYHIKLLHAAGSQLLLSTVRLKHWPLGGSNIPRQVVHNCMKCFRSKSNTIEQFMDRFLQALRRFIGRRGYCSDIYSDNGTDFVGARSYLRELLKLQRSDQHKEAVKKECANNHIQWHFITPAAPHFGGLWEAAVRSAKKHLLKVLGENPIPFENMTTLLVQVENCLNSRPMTALTDDPDNLEPLTPGHFIIGEPFQQLPKRSYREVPMNRLNQSQTLQKRLQHFWDRWRVEYLTQLQGRNKRWKKPIDVEAGQLVIIKEDNLPPSRWKMGRIEKVHPGTGGVVRVITLKTASGPSTRPVEKLCFLPAASQSEDNQA
ncbi:uncharacterized protein LOC129741033 [Uranotaenia lowii]|uniref:uncharacterized protein LOC129741033 n=1 Tax=Uranotaenia lowii TaxID=190385 RepID=UPI002478A11D|nr:uncharacterized protein LOC129741033 [Uranotaenia lowii]